MSKGHMVLIHGAFCTGWAMSPWADYFTERGWTCHTPTLRHHEPRQGQPHPDLGRTGITDYVDDLTALIASLDGLPVIVGHSMGGLIAQLLAARGLARAVVALAPSPPWGMLPSTAYEAMSFLGLAVSVGMSWNHPIEPDFTIAAESTLDRLSPAERKRTYAHFVPESGRALHEITHSMFDLNRSTQVEPETVNCPLLAFGGEHDRINSSRTVKRIVDRYEPHTKAYFIELPDASHWIMTEPGGEKALGVTDAWLDIVAME